MLVTSPEQLKGLDHSEIFSIIAGLQAQVAVAISDCQKSQESAAQAENERMWESAMFWVIKDALIVKVGSAEQVETIIQDLTPTAQQLFDSWCKDLTSRPSTRIPA